MAGDKTFTKDVGTVQFPDRNFSRPIATDPTDLVKTAANLALEGYTAKVASDLEGGTTEPGPANDPTLKSGMAGVSPDVDKELSLSKIAKMRQQGLLTDSGAKILAAKAVQSASARLPGKASEFRSQAAAFFGDFGPGTGLLDKTAGEKQQAALQSHLDNLAINNGLANVTPSGPVVTDEHRNIVLNRLNQTSQIELENKRIENGFAQGRVAAAQTYNYASGIAHNETLGILGKMQARITNDGSIMKPEELMNEIGLAKQRALSAAQSRLQDKMVDPSVISTTTNNINEYFKNIETMVTSQSFSTIMKTNRDGMMAYLDVAGAKAFPMLALAERAAPGTGAKFVVDTMQRMQNMNPEQLKNWYKNDPGAALVGDFQQQLPSLIEGLRNVTNGILPDRKVSPGAYNSTVLGAASAALDSNPDTTPESKQKGIDILNKSVASGDRQSIYVMGDPRVAINTTPEQRKQLVFGLANEVAKVKMSLPAIMSEAKNLSFAGELPLQDILTYKAGEFIFNPLVTTGSYNDLLSGPTDIKQAAMITSPEILNSIKTLNAVAKVLRTYETSPEFERALGGKTPDEYLKGLLSDLHAITVEQTKAGKSRNKQVESGRIDSWRGATPKESVMPQPATEILSEGENADINVQIAALQKRQKELEAVARSAGATEEDISGVGPRK
jgi:hypothetical protein